MFRPTVVIWLVSTVLALAVILTAYTGISVPVATPIIVGHTFETLLLAYILLWLGTIFRDF